MTRKKDFKGLTQSIIGDELKSLDDFLSRSDTRATVIETQPPITDASQLIQVEEESHVESGADVISPTQMSVATDAQSGVGNSIVQEHQQDDKARLTLFISTRTTYELERLKTEMRRLASRSDLSKISKSSIVEAAVDIVAGELKANGLNGILGKLILKK